MNVDEIPPNPVSQHITHPNSEFERANPAVRNLTAPHKNFNPQDVTSPAVDFTGTVVEQAIAAINHAQNEFHRTIEKFSPERRNYTTDNWAAQLDKFADTGAYAALDHHVAQVQNRRDQAQSHLDEVRRSLSPDGDTAVELRASRFWNRSKGVLDSKQDSSEVMHTARALIAKSTPAELGTLLQELPAYCSARGVKDLNWIDDTAGTVAPEYRKAAKQLAKAKQAATLVEYSARSLRRNIETRQERRVVLPVTMKSGVSLDKYDPDK